MPGDTGAIADKEDEEDDHRQKSQHRFRIMNRGQRQMADQDSGFHQRNKVEDEAQSNCRLDYFGQQVTALAEQQ